MNIKSKLLYEFYLPVVLKELQFKSVKLVTMTLLVNVVELVELVLVSLAKL